jgi:5-formyltetrahydrofolate cyclo-ligase
MARLTPEVHAARQRLRQFRLALPSATRSAAERAILRGLRELRVFRPGARVGIYLAIRGEVSLAAGLPAARGSGARLYAPKITSRRRRTMVFVPFDPRAGTISNAFGIAEPFARTAERQPVASLDTVIVPLVGFDRRGVRLGMGAGYYDRALRRRRDPSRQWSRPRLIGVAFASQELALIDPAPWDVPLDFVVTEREIVRCRPESLSATTSPT